MKYIVTLLLKTTVKNTLAAINVVHKKLAMLKPDEMAACTMHR